MPMLLSLLLLLPSLPARCASGPAVPQAVGERTGRRVSVQFAEHVLARADPARAAVEATCDYKTSRQRGRHCSWTSSDPADEKQWLVEGSWVVSLQLDLKTGRLDYHRADIGKGTKDSSRLLHETLTPAEVAALRLPPPSSVLEAVPEGSRADFWALARRLGEKVSPRLSR